MNHQFGIKEKTSRLGAHLAQIVCVISLSLFAQITLAQDTDGDSILDVDDNCTLAANMDQRDTDSDGIGSACDPDLNQDCLVNFADIAQFGTVFLTGDENADFNGDGAVNFVDYVLLTGAFLSNPGPSGIENICSSDGTLVVEGSTGPVPINGGLVSAVLDQTAAGGTVVVVNATTNTDGTFEVTFNDVNDSDFITLAVIGLGTQTGFSLSSMAGSVETLSLAGGSDGSVAFSEAAALRLTPATTAFSVLASEAQGSDVNSQAALDAVAVGVDVAQWMDLATLLTAIIQDPAVSLPAGSTDTLTLAASGAARTDSLVRLKTDQLIAYDAAVVSVIEEGSSTSSYSGESFSGVINSTYLNNIFSIPNTVQLEFGAGNVVTYVSEATTTGTWSVDAAGSLVVTLDAPLLVNSFVVPIDDPNNPGFTIQTERNQFVTDVVITRLRDGVLADFAVVSKPSFFSFPEFPELDNIVINTEKNIEGARTVIDSDSALPFTASELAGTGVAMDHYHQNNQSEGVNLDDRRGFDTLDFVADGTGTSRRRGFAFNWEVFASGELSIVFANGDINRYKKLFNAVEGTSVTNLLYQVAGESEASRRAYVVPRNEADAFDSSMLPGKTYRSFAATGGTFSLPVNSVFDFVFSNGGEACRGPDSTISNWAWEVVDGRLELLRTFTSSDTAFLARSWEPIRIVGDRYWVIETLQLENSGGPAADASVTPGRMNIYELRHDSVGNSRPTLTDDAYVTSVDTPITIYLTDLFNNDFDLEGDQIIYRRFTGNQLPIANEFVNDNAPYAFRYTPSPGFTGVETFEIEASDIACRGVSTVPTSTISITVN
ncbi:MAG: Ig-like domain-containing protein [Gammaproteobacteria bacterium]